VGGGSKTDEFPWLVHLARSGAAAAGLVGQIAHRFPGRIGQVIYPFHSCTSRSDFVRFYIAEIAFLAIASAWVYRLSVFILWETERRTVDNIGESQGTMFPPVVVLVRTRRDLRDALAELRWAGLISLPRSLAADNVLDDPIAAVPPPSEQAEERPAVRPASDEKPTSAPPGLPGRLVPLWPDAGEALGYRSRSATYDAASKGFIQTVTLGRKLKKVSTVWLNQVLAGGLNTVLARINTARPIRPETESGPPRTGQAASPIITAPEGSTRTPVAPTPPRIQADAHSHQTG
jgi:hypothetical protein